MNFEIIKQPQPICWADNSVEYVFAATHYGPAQQAQDVRLQVKILMEQAYNSGIYTEVRSEILLPDASGICRINIGSVADAYLKYFIPDVNWQAGIRANGQSARFKIAYMPIVGNLPYIELNTDPICIIKGGLPNDGLMVTNDWFYANDSDYILLSTITRFKTSQRGFFSVLYKGEDTHLPKTRWVLLNFDDTETQIEVPFVGDIKTGDIICVPYRMVSDFTTHSFKGAKLEICIDTFDDPPVFSSYAPWVAKKSAGKTILFVNSTGGLDSLFCEGNHGTGADYAQQTVELAPSTQGQNQLPGSISDDASATLTAYAHTGFISKADEAIVNALLLNKTSFLILGSTAFKTMQPIVISKKKHEGPARMGFLYDVRIEWTEANTHSHFNQFSIGNIIAQACPALDGFTAVWQTGFDVRVSWSCPPPYNNIQVEAEGATYSLQGAAGSEIITLPDTATGTLNVTARLVCGQYWDDVEEEWAYSLGPSIVAPITIGADLPPVAVEDEFRVPAGYNSLVQLSGNVLTNDHDPEGAAIECVPASGVTQQGGLYTLAASGVVSYKPFSPTFTGLDSFPYTIRESGNYASTASSVVRLLVNQSFIIYARVERVVGSSSGGAGGTNIRASYYLRYYSNPECTAPVNVSQFALTINYRQTVQQDELNGTPMSTVNTDLSIAATGIENLIADNIYWVRFYFVYKKTTTFTCLPGNGYTALQ